MQKNNKVSPTFEGRFMRKWVFPNIFIWLYTYRKCPHKPKTVLCLPSAERSYSHVMSSGVPCFLRKAEEHARPAPPWASPKFVH